MNSINAATLDYPAGGVAVANPSRLNASGVSWGAIFAGAAAAAALSLVLLMLGVGLGLSAVSPWARDGIGATTLGVSTIVWITFTQLVASGMGGYLAGRLRSRWIAVHTDEVYFRDTAHGFLAWAIASLATAALLTSVIGSVISGGVQAGATVAGGAVAAAATGITANADQKSAASSYDATPSGYFIDTLFRRVPGAPAGSTTVSADINSNATGGEVTRIFMNTLRTGALSAEDTRYVGQLVAQRTGLTQQEAEKRVADTYARMQQNLRDIETAAKEAADKARKASAYAALWLFISLLVGAFVASLAATIGGRQRDA